MWVLYPRYLIYGHTIHNIFSYLDIYLMETTYSYYILKLKNTNDPFISFETSESSQRQY